MRAAAALFLGLASAAHAGPKVAVIDTGLDLNDPRFSGKLCQSGHRDFTTTGLIDTNGHGTHVAGLIRRHAGAADYCLLILKYYVEGMTGETNVRREVDAIRYAIEQGATVINLSVEGDEFEEQEYLTMRAHPEVRFFVAAGNSGRNISHPGEGSYPAMYLLPNVIPVGSVDVHRRRAASSNYGPRIEHWEIGHPAKSEWIGTGRFKYSTTYAASGTSMATAIATGKSVAGTLRKSQPLDPLCTSRSCDLPRSNPRW